MRKFFIRCNLLSASNAHLRPPGGRPLAYLLVLLSLGFALPVSAAPSQFGGLIQVSSAEGRVVAIENNLFERQTYDAAGARFTFAPWIWDPALGEWVYAVTPGEDWSWRWRDEHSDAVLATHHISFIGGEDLCWSNGHCGPVTAWWAAMSLQCMEETGRVRVEVFHRGMLIGADSIKPTRFVPQIHQTLLNDSIEPKRTRSRDGSFTDVTALIMDDIGCARPIQGAQVRLASTIADSGTNGQQYLVKGDRGTGKFSSLGFDAVLNPESSDQNDTVIEGRSDAQGFFKARYQAQSHAAEETITFDVRRPATATEPALRGESVEEALLIAVPGLVQIKHENAPLAFRDGGTCAPLHEPLPHWLTPNTRSRVIAMAAIYHVATGRLLSLNDASLEMGGVIARGRVSAHHETQDEGTPRCHGSHRQGTDIDINSVDRLVGDPGDEPEGKNMRQETILVNEEPWTLLKYVDELARRSGAVPYHSSRSIHYRFPD